MTKNRIILSFVCVVIIGLSLIIYSFVSKRPIETVSADVYIESEQILANFNGKIQDFKFKTYDNVKTGDIIATVEVVQPEGFCNNKTAMQNKQKQAMAEYENAAIMYKDGIISQSEYDASLEKLRKTQNQKVCTGEATHVENIYAFKDGKIYYSQLKPGDEVSEDDVLAELSTSKPQIHAYFSPAKTKKINPNSAIAHITIVKYPEKPLTGVIKTVSTGDIMGNLLIIDINEDVSDMNIQNGDAAIVRINR